MKKLTLLLVICFLFPSCKNTWDSEARELFLQGCLESAEESNTPAKQAESMCNCRLEKAMEKYPNFSQAMEHVDDMMNDPDMKACK